MKLQENQLFANRYMLGQKIGIGGFSEVWKASDQYIPGTVVALKIYATDRGLDKESIERFSDEYMLTRSLRHKHLVEVIYYDVYQQSPYLVMPFYGNGSLARVLDTNGPLSESEIARLMHQIGDALNYLHTQNPPLLHRDIKPDNILIDDNGNYLLSDFGISRRVKHTVAKHTGRGTEESMSVAYSAPERFSKNPQATAASDVFSLGVMLYQLSTGYLPWDESGGIALLRGAEIPDIPTDYTRKLNQIINQCMEVDPLKRPTAAQLRHWAYEFMTGGYWNMHPASGDEEERKKRKKKYVLSAALVSGLLILILSFVMLNREQSDGSVASGNVKEQPEQKSGEVTKQSNDAETDVADPAVVVSDLEKDKTRQNSDKTRNSKVGNGASTKADTTLTDPGKVSKPTPTFPQDASTPADLPKDTAQWNRTLRAKDSLRKVYEERLAKKNKNKQ